MRELPKTDAGSEYIQFRGRQTSVVLDEFGIRFDTTVKESPSGETFRMHNPLPVADAEAIRAGEAPANAVAREVAEQITDGDLANPLICWGVMCEHPLPEDADQDVCHEVFETPESLNGHMSVHSSEEKQGDDDSSDGETETDTDQDEGDK